MCAAGRASNGIVGVLLLSAMGAACSRPARVGSLIDAYSSAKCISPKIAMDVQPASRQWDASLELRDGRHVTVLGLRAPGGSIQLRYPGTEALVIAAHAGDYLYPSDVRWDSVHERLYVRAQGVSAAPWIGEQTVLFEYDVPAGQQRNRQVVDAKGLPPECDVAAEPRK